MDSSVIDEDPMIKSFNRDETIVGRRKIRKKTLIITPLLEYYLYHYYKERGERTSKMRDQIQGSSRPLFFPPNISGASKRVIMQTILWRGRGDL